MKKCPECDRDDPLWDGKSRTLAIVGNLNVGKSVLFDRMCGTRTTSLNVPGTTVSVRKGHIKGTDYDVYDTPGAYSVFSMNEDERASRDLLLPGGDSISGVDGIILVADAKNLKRSIAIALQYAGYGLPMLLVVNMVDEAASRGIEIDSDSLSEVFGIDVCATVASDGIGVSSVISRLSDMRVPRRLVEYPAGVKGFLEIMDKLLTSAVVSPEALGLLLLNGDRGAEEYVERNFGPGMLRQVKDLVDEFQREAPGECRVQMGTLYNMKAVQIASMVQEVEPPSRNEYLIIFGDWCTQLRTGIPIAFAVLVLMYLFVGVFGATFLVDTLNGTVFEGFLIPWVSKVVEPIPSLLLRDMIVDPDFGVLPTGVFLALGLVLPVIFCFYIAFRILEDSGYLSRISILLDKIFKKMGLNGKGVIPLVMGFSCVTMAILTTRMLDTKKERYIATFLLLLGMPCAPLLAVMLVILNKMPISATFTVFGIIFSQMLIAGLLANRILPGERASLLMEIPPMRVPNLFQVLKISASKTCFFMKEAVPIFIMASLVVFLFERAGGLAALERFFRPVISGFMGLPEKSVQVFIKTVIRRESGAVELEHINGIYTNLQLVVNLLVMTFLTPCINATIVLYKERGGMAASAIIGAVTVYAVAIGSIVSQTCRFFGITFT